MILAFIICLFLPNVAQIIEHKISNNESLNGKNEKIKRCYNNFKVQEVCQKWSLLVLCAEPYLKDVYEVKDVKLATE